MTYRISSLFPLFCLLFVFAVVSLHDPFRGELGKNAVAKSTSEQCEAPAVPGVPVQVSWARDHCAQKTVRRRAPTTYKALRGARPSCVSSFCHGNTEYWICLDAVCLSSRHHGWFELYLGSLCWKNGRALLIHAVTCWCCWPCWWFGCSAFSQLPERPPRRHPVSLPGWQWAGGRALVWGFCMALRQNRRH